MNWKKGFIRLGIVVCALVMMAWLALLLKIYHFSPFNSGVSTIVVLLALGWVLHSTFFWIAEGFNGNKKSLTRI